MLGYDVTDVRDFYSVVHCILAFSIIPTFFQVTVGRAEIVNGKKKIDKGFEVKKIYIHKLAPYPRVLVKCTKAVWGDGPENSSYVFSLLDGGGTIVADEIVMDQPDGTDKSFPWTLDLYAMVNKKSYACNPRFNILRVKLKHCKFCQ